MTESLPGVLLAALILAALIWRANREAQRQQRRDVADQQAAYLATGFGSQWAADQEYLDWLEANGLTG